MPPMLPDTIEDDVRRALAEDLGPGDATASLIDPAAVGSAHVTAREPAVLCGSAWFAAVFDAVDPAVDIDWLAEDGDRIEADEIVCRLTGPSRALLTGERTALNFLQSLSGTATLAAAYRDAVAGTDCRVLDTRKTIPGLRAAQKYAVRCGGCHNHRMGLWDAVLIKENHIMAAGSIGAAVRRSRKRHPALTVEVEVENSSQLREAVAAGADRIMLDNFDPEALRQAVDEVRALPAVSPPELEASGNVDLDTIGTIAATGVDFVSVGSLTKHVRAIDLSMRFALTV